MGRLPAASPDGGTRSTFCPTGHLGRHPSQLWASRWHTGQISDVLGRMVPWGTRPEVSSAQSWGEQAHARPGPRRQLHEDGEMALPQPVESTGPGQAGSTAIPVSPHVLKELPTAHNWSIDYETEAERG